MKSILFLTAHLLLLSVSVIAQKASPGKIVGVWFSKDENLKIEIYKAGPQYFGKQIWGTFLYEPDGRTAKKDLNNTIERNRRRDLDNLIILQNLDYYGNAYGGIFYDYKTGRTYKAILKLTGENTIKIRGYTVLSLFGNTTTWTRIQ